MATHAISTPARAPHLKSAHRPRRLPVSAARRAYLSEIMNLAWSKFRFERLGATPCAFAAALRHAWAWSKGESARAAAATRWNEAASHRVVRVAPVALSPIRRSLTGKPYAARLAWDAGRLTSRLGR
jgi:hypothetical protein